MLRDISIKRLLILSGVSCVIGLIILLFTVSFSISKISLLENIKFSLSNLESKNNLLTKYSYSFMNSKNEKDVKNFNKTIKEIRILSKKLIENTDTSSQIIMNTKELLKYSNNFALAFDKVVNQQRLIGLNHEEGLLSDISDGSDSLDEIGEEIGSYKLTLSLDILKLYQRDYLLTKNIFFADALYERIDFMFNNVTNDKERFSDSQKTDIKNYLTEFKKHFSRLVDATIVIGIDDQNGLKLEMANAHTMLEKTFENILKKTDLELEEQIENKIFVINAVALFMILLLIIITIIAIKKTTDSLNVLGSSLNKFFSYLNKETKDISLLEESTNTEIGLMSIEINKNIKIIKTNMEEDSQLLQEAEIVIGRVKHGWYSQTIEKSTSNESLNNFKNDVNEMIRATKAHFTSVNKSLSEYSSYNYTNELKIDSIEKGGVFELLINDINKLRNAITSMLVENKQNGLTLSRSSDILLVNVDTLNRNSHQSAVALEETAAALEEVTSIISSNTKNVVRMSKFASQITTSANEGQELAKQTTIAMNEIDTEVNAINDAIAVIDQIAFQTNILSLNAAVEAATAGEAGKGFAVVAQEVRNLASRSAEAASEIKDIVTSATQKANEGKVISDKMIQGYTGLHNNISETINLIDDITEASKEQQRGIVQINDSVTILDQQKQENASIASQTNEVAIQTDTIAKLIVDNANEKNFVGKDTVIAKTTEEVTFIEKRNPNRKNNYTGKERRNRSN